MDRDRFGKIREKLTGDYLQKISVRIIEARKNREQSKIREWGKTLFENDAVLLDDNTLFLRLIKHYHPDRLSHYMKRLDKAFSDGNNEDLLFFEKLTAVKITPAPLISKDYSDDSEEIWDYDPDDFGYDEYDFNDYAEEEDFFREEESERDFLTVLREALAGNRELDLSPADLESLEGELDLSGRDLYDLDGLEYCRNISVLNLAGNNIDHIQTVGGLYRLIELSLADNRIDDIEPIGNLKFLKILDLSGNEIEDISPLLNLDKLEFVDLRGNSVRDKKNLLKLKEKGVSVFT